MSTISGLTSSTSYPYTAAATAVTGAQTQASAAQVILSSQTANSASPLTYNSAGLFNATAQAKSAQSAALAVQDTITQTLGSLMTGTSSNSAAADLFGANSSSAFGSYAPKATGNTIQTAKNAYFSAEEAVNQAFSSIA